MDDDGERVLRRGPGEWTLLPELLGSQQSMQMRFRQDPALGAMVAVDHLEILAPAQSEIVKDQTGEQMLQHEIVQNNDTRMLPADPPDRVVITRIVSHLVKRDVGFVDGAPRRTSRIVMPNGRMRLRLRLPLRFARPHDDLRFLREQRQQIGCEPRNFRARRRER
jgi:hypothetical protein